jgi:NodT family efflux transporter outer membrane factor (OMF) lipoprotein
MRVPAWFACGCAAAASAALLSGCAGIEAPPLAPPIPADWRHAPATREAAPQVQSSDWWRVFHDPNLDRLIDAALRDNPSVAEARERLLAARALQRRAHTEFLPKLRAKTEDAIDPDASASFFVAGFDATWELGLFGRGAASARLAAGESDARAADLQQVRVSLVGEVVRDWIALCAARQRESILTAVRDLRRQRLEQTQVRQRLALASAQAVDQAEADWHQAEAALAEVAAESDALVQQLARLLGRSEPEAGWIQSAGLPALGEFRVLAAPADLLRTRPEIMRAEADVLGAAGAAGLARADLFPRLALGGSIIWSSRLVTNRDASDNMIASAGPLIDIPLFDWGARLAALDASRHALQAAVYAYRAAVLRGVAEVETALGALEQQRRREVETGQARDAMARADAATAIRVRLQLAAPAERIDSALTLAQASLAWSDAVAARDLGFVSLYKALGGAPVPATSDAAPGERSE